MKTLSEILFKSEKNFQNNLACSIKGREYSYKALFDRAHEIARSIPPEVSRIGVTAKNDLDTYSGIFAIWILGKTYIPIVSSFYRSTNEACQKLGIEYVLDQQVCANIPPVSSNNSLAYILSTSGTTGEPKQIPISYENVSAFIDSFLSMDVKLNEQDRFLQMAELSFDMSIISFLIPICIGASFHTIDEDSNRSLAAIKTIEEQKLSIVIAAPSSIEFLRPYFNEIKLPYVKHTFFGAENLNTSLTETWLKCTPNGHITNLYGPTEGGIFCAYQHYVPANQYDESIPIGINAKNIEFAFEPRDNKLHELLIHGKQVFNGYAGAINDCFEQRNNKAFYRTGDLVTWNERKELIFVKRLDQQLKHLGKRINIDLIRNVILTELKDSDNFSIHYETNAFVEVRLNKSLFDSELAKRIEDKLPPYYPTIKIVSSL